MKQRHICLFSITFTEAWDSTEGLTADDVHAAIHALFPHISQDGKAVRVRDVTADAAELEADMRSNVRPLSYLDSAVASSVAHYGDHLHAVRHGISYSREKPMTEYQAGFTEGYIDGANGREGRFFRSSPDRYDSSVHERTPDGWRTCPPEALEYADGYRAGWKKGHEEERSG